MACKPLETVRCCRCVTGSRDTSTTGSTKSSCGRREGAVRIGGDDAIYAGALVVLPNGTAHAFERRGKNPLIVLSTLTGSPCEVSKTAP